MDVRCGYFLVVRDVDMDEVLLRTLWCCAGCSLGVLNKRDGHVRSGVDVVWWCTPAVFSVYLSELTSVFMKRCTIPAV